MPDPSIIARLKQRKVVQWAIAYLAAAFVVVQLMDAVAEPLHLTDVFQQGLLIALIAGFVITMVLAWHHGEKGHGVSVEWSS